MAHPQLLRKMSETQIILAYRRQRHIIQCYLEDLPNNIELKMVEIPAGSFVMGAPEEEAESTKDERPQHEVNVPAFWMGKYQVTQAQWKAVAGLPQIERELNPDPSEFKGDNLPVECVSWLDVVEFCQRLSVYTKREYRLPSEAEWEYACRAMPSPPMGKYSRIDGSFNYDGTIALGIVRTRGQIYPPFHFGETITTALVNYDGNYPYGQAPKGEYRKKTTPVGSFPPNAFGLCDMHGNVWEWCEDDWHDSYTDAPTDGRAWVNNNDNRSQEEVSKLLRGGSWSIIAWYCRSAYRNRYGARLQNNNNGFRVVCVLQ